MWAIYKKELRGLFESPKFYLLAAIYSFLLGQVFFSFLASREQFTNQTLTHSVLVPFFGQVHLLFLFLIPMLATSAFSEERKRGTLFLLKKSPLKFPSIFLGKFFSQLTGGSVLLGLSLVFPFLLAVNGHSDWEMVLSAYLGLFLTLGLYFSIGLFCSMLSENSILVAFMTMAILWTAMLLAATSQTTSNLAVSSLLNYFSPQYHLMAFLRGSLISFHIFYFASFMGLFYFLSQLVWESLE